MTLSEQSKEGNGYLSRPKEDGSPAVVILPAWWGLNVFFRDLCDQFSDAGFLAYAPDLYDDVANTIEKAKHLRDRLDRETVQRDTRRAVRHVQALGASSSVGVVGFSLGAHFALELLENNSDPVAAVTIFYGGGTKQLKQTRAAVQGHFAEVDEWGPESDEVGVLRKRITSAGGTSDFHIYPNTGHWFFEQDRVDAYDPDAASLAWNRTINFLNKHLSTER